MQRRAKAVSKGTVRLSKDLKGPNVNASAIAPTALAKAAKIKISERVKTRTPR